MTRHGNTAVHTYAKCSSSRPRQGTFPPLLLLQLRQLLLLVPLLRPGTHCCAQQERVSEGLGVLLRAFLQRRNDERAVHLPLAVRRRASPGLAVRVPVFCFF